MRIIAGPCQHESYEKSLSIAKVCKQVCESYGYEYYFKASFDKANRTSNNGIRGIGLKSTMNDFLSLKDAISDLRILTDVHERNDIQLIEVEYCDAIDVYQIPAFLCRQTDLIKSACSTNKIVNIKKGQFLAPWDIGGILSKVGDSPVWITERGTSFGYNTLVVDFTGIYYMLNNYSVPIVFDVTHSVQKPCGNGMSSGGNRDYVAPLARAASAMGVSNYFIEVCHDPDSSPSDGPNMISLDNFENLIKQIHDSYHKL